MTLSLESILVLYEQHREALARVRREMRRLHARKCTSWRQRSPLHGAMAKVLRPLVPGIGEARMLAQLDDEVCEILYLLVRDRKPRTVVEISPFHGWSSCWLLSALRDNGSGALASFDLLDTARRNVPQELQDGRWTLTVGDVRARAGAVPAAIDFLLMDSDHSREFAEWYVRHVFPRVLPGAVVAVDDVFHSADPASFDGEGRVLVDWLAHRRLPWFTCARAANPTALNAIHGWKTAAGMGPRIRRGDANTTVLFEMPGIPERHESPAVATPAS